MPSHEYYGQGDRPVTLTLQISDRDALFQAAELVRSVVARHPAEASGQIITAMLACVHDIDVLGRMLQITS